MSELRSQAAAVSVLAVMSAAAISMPLACRAPGVPEPAGSVSGGNAGPPAQATPVDVSCTPGATAGLAHGADVDSSGAGLHFEIHDAASGAAMPGKLTVIGAAGTPDPRWTRSDLPRESAGFILAYNRVFSLSGVGTAPIAPGTYDVTVSRGLEWDTVTVRGVRVEAGRGTTVSGLLHHVVDTPGWLSADFHVHAAMSPDSRVPMVARVYEFVAEGIDLIVSTDHNVVSDYAPYIAELGASHLLASARGDEITTAAWGHFGAFPLPPQLERAGHGAIAPEGSPNDVFRRVRKQAPDAVIDVHHPRLSEAIGYFDRGLFDAQADRAGQRGFSFDFDAIEVLNGFQDPDRKSVDRVIADWMALLDHGHLVTATGNSDTHHLNYNLAGYPRNYVRVTDDPARLVPTDVGAALKQHAAFFTTGPIVNVSVGPASIGSLAPATDGRARIDVEVRAAPWVSVSTVVLYVGGREFARRPVPASTDVVRFREGFDVDVAQDTTAIVRVDGDRPLSPVIGDGSRFVVYPLALTNPVFLDRDGDGRFDPPLPHGPHTQP